jgi:hypothetical protein
VAKRNNNDLIDESSQESFPASDPPSWTARGPSDVPAEAGSTAVTRQSAFGQLAKIPREFFLSAGLAALGTSIGFFVAGKRETAAVVGIWAPALLLLGVYNDLARMRDRYREELH